MVQAELKRSIKFRVWNSNENCFDDPRCLEVFDDSGELHHLLDNHNDFYTIQQCTGVQDINGKDIYEGDFVKGITDNEYGAVYWDKEYLGFRYISNKFNMPLSNNLKILEVVGNIFEGVPKENKPKELQIGDEVTVQGQSSFCSTSKSKITDIQTKYDENTGVPYKVYITGDHRFDGRNGWALNPPTAYYIKELQNQIPNDIKDETEDEKSVNDLLDVLGF